MLRVLRCVAIERMQTALPGFGAPGLNTLIMSTGYPSAAQPHADAVDLIYVAAANLANAAGGRPKPPEFADAVVQAMQNGGYFTAGPPRHLNHAPTAPHLATLLAKLTPSPRWSAAMKSFRNSAASIAKGAAGRATHASMIGGIVDVSDWLMNTYSGSASALHGAMTGTAAAPHHAVWHAICSVDGFRGHGVALAANLLKDSQVPGLALICNPQTIARVHAGWFAKPDLHVIRFMAKISRGVSLHAGRRRQLLKMARRSMTNPPVGARVLANFPGSYSHLPSKSPDLRVIADIHDWAAACHTSALEIDRVLYLIAARRVDIPQPHGGSVTVTRDWYARAEAAINVALAAGIPRMS